MRFNYDRWNDELILFSQKEKGETHRTWWSITRRDRERHAHNNNSSTLRETIGLRNFKREVKGRRETVREEDAYLKEFIGKRD